MITIIPRIRPYAAWLMAFWLLTIVIMSSIPGIPTLKLHTAKTDIRLDYMMHFSEYGLLAFLTYLSFVRSDFVIIKSRFFMITAGLVLFAIMDEFHQKLIPGRSFNLFDMASNVSGILAACIFSISVFRIISLGKIKKDKD
jgi:VanZ family protein